MPRVALCGLNLAPGMAPAGRSSCSNYFFELERSSRLALTCADAALFRSRSQVKRGQPTRRKLRTQLRRAFPRKRERVCLVLACGPPRGRPGANVNMDPAET